MQKYLRKLKSLILAYADENEINHFDEHTPLNENAILQILQTLLKIAELSHTLNEPGAIASCSISTNATGETADNGIKYRGHSSYLTNLLPTKTIINTPSTPKRLVTSESGDGDYFSTKASIMMPDSELEMSEGDEDYYATADEGYEADVEVMEATDTEVEIEVDELWNSFQPASRYRTHVLHEGLCRLVIEIMIELSVKCIKNPDAWTDNLTQLANRLFVVRESLGGSLFLLKGFAPLLSCNDSRLKGRLVMSHYTH